MIYCGIDPGKSGALAALTESGGAIGVHPMPILAGRVDHLDLVALLTSFSQCDDVTVYCELVGALPTDARKAAFEFGMAFDAVIAACAFAEVSLSLVRPVAWKKVILEGLPWSSPDKKKRKAAAIAWASKRFPAVSLRKTARCTTDNDNYAEALAIAEYGRRQHAGGR